MAVLSVVIPAYNEEKTIRKVLQMVKNVNLEKYKVKKEIIVVSDGSRDNTVSEAKKEKGVRVIEQKPNMGKGAAVRAGIQNSTGDIVIIQDADMEYDPNDYPLIIAPILEGKARVVYGSRFLKLVKEQKGHFLKKHKKGYTLAAIGGRIVTLAANLLFGTRITDEATCYKCFRSDVIKSIKIKSNKFNWEPEVTAKIAKKGIKIHEVPISYMPRTFEEGKKINWKDGFQALWTLFKYRFKD